MIKILSSKISSIAGRKQIFWITIFLFAAGITFFYVILLFRSVSTEIYAIPEGLEDYLLVQRFVGSSSCFLLKDEKINRYYPGIIDWDNFDKININECYKGGDKVKSFKLILRNIETSENKIVKTSGWNDIITQSRSMYVKVFSKEKLHNGELEVEIQSA